LGEILPHPSYNPLSSNNLRYLHLINFELKTWHAIWICGYRKLDENLNPSISDIMRTTILALVLTFISLGAIETKAEVSATSKKNHASYSSRMYAKRSIRNAKISISRARRFVDNWSPYRADLAEAIRHQQYALDLYYWGDYYEAAKNSDYAGRIAEYVLFQAYDNGYCSNNDYFGSNNNSGWFWGNNNGWGFGYSQNNSYGNNGYGNNGYNNGYNNNGYDNNGWNNGNSGYDDDLYKKGKDKNKSGPRRKGGSENGFDNNDGMNNSGNPRYNGGNNKPNMDPNESSNPRANKPNFDNNNLSNPRKDGFENGTQQPKMTAPQQGNSQMEKPQMDDTKRSEMKSAFEKMKLDKPDDSKMKMKSKSDDEVLKSEEKLDMDL
jgi:hypothetical protein